MIDWLQAFWLAIIQGITEFLPISSSGHLAITPWLFGWSDQGLSFDVAVHVGTLLAVVTYMRREIAELSVGWWRSIRYGEHSFYSKLAWYIGIATIFVGVVGVVAGHWIEAYLRSPIVIGLATIGFGVVLWWCDKVGVKNRPLESITKNDAIVIGIAQALALIPGTSRSGITISAGLLMGLNRESAARFSFLLSIPVIILSGLWQTKALALSPEPVQWSVLVFATIIAAVTAFICIYWFLHYIQRFSMMPFVIYRLILGAVILYMFW